MPFKKRLTRYQWTAERHAMAAYGIAVWRASELPCIDDVIRRVVRGPTPWVLAIEDGPDVPLGSGPMSLAAARRHAREWLLSQDPGEWPDNERCGGLVLPAWHGQGGIDWLDVLRERAVVEVTVRAIRRRQRRATTP